MARHTYPRPDRHHEVGAQNILARHAVATGTPVTLPVPIEMIVESTYGLTVVWDDIPESNESMILGALFPSQQRIVINTRHLDLMERVIGPERFTLAHELAHWIYDADDPNQLAFAVDEVSPPEQYCYDRTATALPENTRLREMNANKLASHVLLPEQLVRAVAIDDVLDDFVASARTWGVSQQTLRIRLETLGLIDTMDPDRLLAW